MAGKSPILFMLHFSGCFLSKAITTGSFCVPTQPVYLLFSCCVDEVAAEHVGADCIVHYGTSCLSPCRRLPLLYVFGKRPIDVQQCAAAFKELYPDPQSHVIVLYDVTYSHAIGNCYCLC